MANKRILYLVEGQCEEKLINALKNEPYLIKPGKVKCFNPMGRKLTPNDFITIQPGSLIALVFDTDTTNGIDILESNIKMIKKYGGKCEIALILQVKNIEDELVKSTDISQIEELTKSKSKDNFKTDFCALKNCRRLLEKHHFNINKIWTQNPGGGFKKYHQESFKIKR